MRRRGLERKPISNAFSTAASSLCTAQRGFVGLFIQYQNCCHFLFFADDTPSLATLIPSICSIVSLPFSILSISLRKELYSNSLMCCYRHVTLNYSVVLCLGFFFSPFNPSIFTVSLTLALSLSLSRSVCSERDSHRGGIVSSAYSRY